MWKKRWKSICAGGAGVLVVLSILFYSWERSNREATSDCVSAMIPEYTDFAQGALLIGEGRFAEALVRAQALKQRLEGSSDDAVYIGNLVRIAALERELGSKEGELAAWRELEAKAQSKDAYRSILDNFREGEVSLRDYIVHRKEELNHE